MPELDYLCPELGISGVRVVSTTRLGGVSLPPYDSLNLGDHVGDTSEHVSANRQLLIESIAPAPTIHWLKQVHGTAVVALPDAGVLPEADAAWTSQPLEACTIMTADCLPIVLADREARCVAAVHGGWRGLAAGVLQATLNELPVSPESLVAWFGPSIGAKAFEVGAEVLDAFGVSPQDHAVTVNLQKPGHFFLDLNAIATQQLLSAGVCSDAILGGEHCSLSNPDRFYSHRRDGVTGRMATLVWLTA